MNHHSRHSDTYLASNQAGFTLIEVMIVVAIVAILAAVALPAYGDYIRRGQIAEAFTYLSDYKVKMEQYYQDHRNYGNASGTTCANATGAPSWANFSPSEVKYFTFACALGSSTDNQSYTITATGSAQRATGHVYTINSSGLKRTTKFKNATVALDCWATKSASCS